MAFPKRNAIVILCGLALFAARHAGLAQGRDEDDE